MTTPGELIMAPGRCSITYIRRTNIPVFQLSIDLNGPPESHYQIGQELLNIFIRFYMYWVHPVTDDSITVFNDSRTLGAISMTSYLIADKN